METFSNYLKTVDNSIDVVKLPETAQRELVTFYDFLVFKYLGQPDTGRNQKRQILSSIFQDAHGTLPLNYTFNRDELHT